MVEVPIGEEFTEHAGVNVVHPTVVFRADDDGRRELFCLNVRKGSAEGYWRGPSRWRNLLGCLAEFETSLRLLILQFTLRQLTDPRFSDDFADGTTMASINRVVSGDLSQVKLACRKKDGVEAYFN